MFFNKSNKLKKNFSNESFILFLLIIFAFLYGSYFYFFPQESITFAKTFLGYYNYNISNTYYTLGIIDSPPTIQILIPYFFLKIGINDLILNRFWGGLTSVISFLSFFYFSKLITKSNFYSVLLVFLFLTHRFIPNHFYGIYFPVSYFYFGQMGMYLCLLSISLLFAKKSKLAVTIMIINFFAHGGWAFFNFIFYLIYKFVKKERFKFCVVNFTIFFLLFFFSLCVYADLKKKIPEIPKQETFFAEKILKENQKKNINSFAYKQSSHQVVFDVKNKYLIFDVLKFIFFELLIIFTLLFHKKFKNEEILLFFKISLFISVLILFYYFILHQWLNIDHLLAKIHNNIPIFIERIIITRFLNINNISILIFFSSYFFYLLNFNNLKFPKFILSLLLIIFSLSILLNGKIISEHIPIIKIEKIFHNFIVYSFVFFVFLYLFFKIKLENILFFLPKKLLNNFFLVSVVFYILTNFFYFSFLKKSIFNIFYQVIENDLKKINNKEYNEIIVSTNIHGYIDIPYLTNSPIILNGFKILDSSKSDYDIFCEKLRNDFFDTKEQFNLFIDKCFELRKKSEWKKIGSALNIKYVITRSNVNLNLKLVSSNSFINIFEISR